MAMMTAKMEKRRPSKVRQMRRMTLTGAGWLSTRPVFGSVCETPQAVRR